MACDESLHCIESQRIFERQDFSQAVMSFLRSKTPTKMTLHIDSWTENGVIMPILTIYQHVI